jgi:hypothetical protein
MEIFNLVLNIMIAATGVMAIVTGKLPFSPTRQITAGMARLVGAVFVIAAVLGFFPATLWLSSLLLIGALVLGWTMGKKIPPKERD